MVSSSKLEHDIDLRTAEDVSELLVEMFGSDPGTKSGVIHVAAVTGENQVLRITDQTPKSPHDAFLLNVSRARANVIVTTGRILREEPDLTHGYLGDENMQRSLASWRRDVVGVEDPGRVLVLTSGKDLNAEHPVFSAARSVTIYTSKEGADALTEVAFGAAEVVAVDRPSIRNVIDFLLTDCGVATVSVEAGPSTTPALYERPVKVDELLLSTFRGAIAPALLAGSFVGNDVLHRLFSRTSSYQVCHQSRDWSFQRFVR